MATSNKLRALNRLPYDFDDGLKIAGIDVTALNQIGTPVGAGLIGLTPVGGIGATNVQAALAELDAEKVRLDALAATSNTFGSSLVGHDGLTLQNVLDNARPLTDIAALRLYGGTAAIVRITKNGQSGFFIKDATDTVTLDNGGTVIVDALNRRWKRLIEASVNLKWFGAKGDGVTDDTTAIKNAIAYCTLYGLQLEIYSGTYLISDAVSGIGCSIIGKGAPIIKNTNTANLATSFLFLFQNTDNILLSGVIFDGQVSSTVNTYNVDPTWTTLNYNTWYGFKGVAFSNCKNLSIKDCSFKNFFWSGLRIDGCTYVAVDDCFMKRSRGTFGDCVYVNKSTFFYFSNCNAYDFTRIGFCSDTDTTNVGSFYGKFNNCTAQYGHDWSGLYGGGESAVAYWFENSAYITCTNCDSINVGYGGFFLNPGTAVSNPTITISAPYAMSLIGCNVVGSVNGILCGGLVGNSSFLIDACNVSVAGGGGNRGIILNALTGSVALVNNCAVTVTGTLPGVCIGLNGASATGTEPQYNITNCTLGHNNATACAARISQAGAAYIGEISQNFSGSYGYSYTVSNCISSSTDGMLMINQASVNTLGSGQSHNVRLSGLADTYLYLNNNTSNYITGLFVDNCSFKNYYGAYVTNFIVSNSTVNGSFTIISNGTFLANRNRITGTTIIGASKIWFSGTPANSNSVAFETLNCNFIGSLAAANSYLIDIRNMATTGNRTSYIMDGCRFINNGGSNGANSAAITAPFNDFMNTGAKSQNFFDSTITTISYSNWGFGSATSSTDPVAISYGVRMTLAA